jgi:hypothetical protein
MVPQIQGTMTRRIGGILRGGGPACAVDLRNLRQAFHLAETGLEARPATQAHPGRERRAGEPRPARLWALVQDDAKDARPGSATTQRRASRGAEARRTAARRWRAELE